MVALDWTNDITIALLVLTFELLIFLPFIGWYVERRIEDRLPEILNKIAENPKCVDAIKKLASKFGMPTGGKMTLNNALGFAIPMLLQKFLGGLPAQVPAIQPPTPP
jgi:hypothetical protein